MNSIKPNKHSRVVLVGGSGFLGRHLTEALLANGFTNIVVVSRSVAKTKYEGVSYELANFSDSSRMAEIVSQGDVVVHLACTSTPALSELDQVSDMQANLIGTIHLLDVCVKKNTRQFIYVSSGGTVYGDHGTEKIHEDAKCDPINAHGAMKLSIEQYIGVYRRQYGLPAVIVRPGNVYGRKPDSMRKQGVIEVFLAKALQGESIMIWGDGSVVRDYVHVDDVANILLRIIEDQLTNGTFNVGTGIGTTLNEIITLIEELTGKTVAVQYRPARSFDVPSIVLDIALAKQQLNWSPKYMLADGLRNLYKNLPQ